MAGKHKKHRICEICELRERHSTEKLFFAKFPLDKDRCKEWLKVTGKEDLVQLPIEKLHQLRYVCGKHFVKKDYTRTGSRLKKRAVPKFNLSKAPLSEDYFAEFPLRIANELVPKQQLQQQKESLVHLPSTSHHDLPETNAVHDIMEIDHTYSRTIHCDHTYYAAGTHSTTENDDPHRDSIVRMDSNPTKIDHTYCRTPLQGDVYKTRPKSQSKIQEVKLPDTESAILDESQTQCFDTDDGDVLETEEIHDEAYRMESPEVVEQAPAIVPPVTCVKCTKLIEKHMFVCAVCSRYEPWCVRCACADHQSAHAACYVLRADVTRPKSEIVGVLCAIRSELAINSFADHLDDTDLEIKSETVEDVEEMDVLDVDPFDHIHTSIITGHKKPFPSSSEPAIEDETSSDDESVGSESDSDDVQPGPSLLSVGDEMDMSVEDHETRPYNVIPSGNVVMSPDNMQLATKCVQVILPRGVQMLPEHFQVLPDGAQIILPEGVKMPPEHILKGVMLPEGVKIIIPEDVQIPNELINILPEGTQFVLPQGVQMLPESVQMIPESDQMVPKGDKIQQEFVKFSPTYNVALNKDIISNKSVKNSSGRIVKKSSESTLRSRQKHCISSRECSVVLERLSLTCQTLNDIIP